jgi:hypothetical protein
MSYYREYALLNGAFWAKAAEVESAFDGVLGIEAEIVRGGPEPEAGDLAGVAEAVLGAEADEHVVLAGGGKVGWRIGVFEDKVDMVAAESFFESGDIYGAIELDGDGEGVTVEDWRMEDMQGDGRPSAGRKSVIMAADARLGCA